MLRAALTLLHPSWIRQPDPARNLAAVRGLFQSPLECGDDRVLAGGRSRTGDRDPATVVALDFLLDPLRRARPAGLLRLGRLDGLAAHELLGDDPFGEGDLLLGRIEPADLVGHRRRQSACLDLLLDTLGEVQQRQGPDDVRIRDVHLPGERTRRPAVQVHESAERLRLLDRHGVDLPRQTTCDWMAACADLL